MTGEGWATSAASQVSLAAGSAEGVVAEAGTAADAGTADVPGTAAAADVRTAADADPEGDGVMEEDPQPATMIASVTARIDELRRAMSDAMIPLANGLTMPLEITCGSPAGQAEVRATIARPGPIGSSGARPCRGPEGPTPGTNPGRPRPQTHRVSAACNNPRNTRRCADR